MKSRNQLAEELYKINADISFMCIALKQRPTIEQMRDLNKELGRIIKELRVDE